MEDERVSGAFIELPKYQCHKVVHALKIKSIVGLLITPEDSGYGQFTVASEYLEKHNPQPGGYYIVYEDGYKSFSPAKAFEEGYTLVK